MTYASYLPAYPLITSDPYLSIWSTSDHPAHSATTHWAGARKRMSMTLTMDGVTYGLIGVRANKVAELTERLVTPTMTRYGFRAGNADITVSFRAPMLLEDMDLMSTPVTFVDCCAKSADGQPCAAKIDFIWHDDI